MTNKGLSIGLGLNQPIMPVPALGGGGGSAPIPEYTLTLSVAAGNGTVGKSPDQATYHPGDTVQVEGIASTGWTFSDWSGDLITGMNPALITITKDEVVAATFTQNHYTLGNAVTGSGITSVVPQQTSYHYGDIVALAGVPASGWAFGSWGGGGANPKNITIVASVVETANFTQNHYTLDTHVTGSGIITVVPSQAEYHYGDVVTISGTPSSAEYIFTSWTGGAAGASPSVGITIVDNTSVTANFSILPFTTEWDFTSGAEGWVFDNVTDGGGMAGTAHDHRLYQTNTGGGWKTSRWTQAFPIDRSLYVPMYPVTLMVMSGYDYGNGINTFHSLIINISGVGEVASDVPSVLGTRAQAGHIIQNLAWKIQNNGVGNAAYMGKIKAAGMYRGEITDPTRSLYWRQHPDVAAQVPNANGFGKVNHILGYTVDWDTDVKYFINWTGAALKAGRLTAEVTIVSSTSPALTKLRLRQGAAPALTGDGSIISYPTGHLITLSGTAAATWNSAGGFEVWMNDDHADYWVELYISKINWTDADGVHTIFSRPWGT